ncbi:hypothetical protein ACMYZ5_04310 [Bacteroides sp. KG68]|uniref:hypothetical protein n=1 Tax=unclassified Bacteroides TaxID=2646097 RepID=UPI003D9920E4
MLFWSSSSPETGLGEELEPVEPEDSDEPEVSQEKASFSISVQPITVSNLNSG